MFLLSSFANCSQNSYLFNHKDCFVLCWLFCLWVFIKTVLPKAGREKWSSLEFSLDPTANILARKLPFEEHEHEWARTCFWFSCKSSFVWTIPFSCLLKLTRRKECFEQSHCLNSVYVLNCCDHGDRNVFLPHQLNSHIFCSLCLYLLHPRMKMWMSGI